jgi:hypothetical protein
MFGLFDSSSSSTQNTNAPTDSYNLSTTTTNTSSLEGGQGNTTLTFGASPDAATLFSYALTGLLALAGIYLINRR